MITIIAALLWVLLAFIAGLALGIWIGRGQR
jgi:uncharacterized protein YneF (UPF0154 family)